MPIIDHCRAPEDGCGLPDSPCDCLCGDCLEADGYESPSDKEGED